MRNVQIQQYQLLVVYIVWKRATLERYFLRNSSHFINQVKNLKNSYWYFTHLLQLILFIVIFNNSAKETGESMDEITKIVTSFFLFSSDQK